MSAGTREPSGPGFVVFRKLDDDTWRLVAEVPRKRGLTARAARTRAILDATNGKVETTDVYAAVRRSEWRVALDSPTPEP